MPAVTEWFEVADRIWVRTYRPFLVNVTVIEVDGGVVVVDTRGSLLQGEQLRGDVDTLGRGPIVAVVNTHEHFDHTFGNAAFADVTRWGHRGCAVNLEKSGEQQRRVTLEWIPEEGHQELRDTPIVPPDMLVDTSVTLRLGGRTLELMHLGLGHTDNDLVVFVPDADALVAGDLVEESGPLAYGDAYPFSWPTTLRRLTELASGAVVPGHGAVVDRAFTSEQQDITAEVAARAVRHVDQDVPVDDLLEDPPIPEPMLRIAFERAHAERRRYGTA
jgi:glyoxylase-like metal-dependent hydrolase (beta-lactamase superfamily II)